MFGFVLEFWNNFSCHYDVRYVAKSHKYGGWQTWHKKFEIMIVVLLLYYCRLMFRPHNWTSLIMFGQVVCQIYLNGN